MRSKLRLRQAWKLALGLLLTLPFFAEVITRIAFAKTLRTRAFPCIYLPDPELGYRYRPSSVGKLCIPDLCRTVPINQNGYFGPAFSAQKKAGDYRIVVISNSDGTGIWTEEGESFVTILRDRLKALSSRIEVINLSIDGRDRDPENLALAREAVAEYAPDLVLLHVRFPFVTRHQQREVYRGYVISYRAGSRAGRDLAIATIDYIESKTIAKAIYDSSYLVRALAAEYFTHSSSDWAWLLQTYNARKFSAGTPAIVESAKASLARVLEANAAFSARGTSLVLLNDGTKPEPAEAVRKHGLDVIYYRRPTGTDFYLPTNGHLNHRGHEVVADEIFEPLLARLRQRGAFTDAQPAQGPAK